jgi:hypothetical protein
MKPCAVVSFIIVLLSFYAVSAQITDETISGENVAEVKRGPNENYASRFKNVHDCEDTCKDDCEKTCKSKCGNDNDKCEDDCTDKCDENCVRDCSILKPAYGPQKGSFLVSISGNYMLFHTSRISEEEDRFLTETDTRMIYLKDNQPVDTLQLKYSYTSMSGTIGVQYFLSDRIGVGLFYEFMQTSEEINNAYQHSSGALINSNTIAAMVTCYAFQKKRIGLSIAGNCGVVWGGLHRYPLMYEDLAQENLTPDEVAYVRAIHEKVSLSGMAFSVNIDFHYMINSFLTVCGGPRYVYRYITLTNDRFVGYPRTSNSNDIGINVSFGLLINGKNTH